jgi:hypothetical protein
MESERTIWKVSVVIEATPEERDAAVEAIARALCPDRTTRAPALCLGRRLPAALDDLDPDEMASWQESFDLDRQPRGPGGEGAG